MLDESFSLRTLMTLEDQKSSEQEPFKESNIITVYSRFVNHNENIILQKNL